MKFFISFLFINFVLFCCLAFYSADIANQDSIFSPRDEQTYQESAVISINNQPDAGIYHVTYGNDWINLLTAPASKIEAGDITGDAVLDIVCNIAGSGLYYYNWASASWSAISTYPVIDFALAKTSESSKRQVVVSFENYGLYIYDNDSSSFERICQIPAEKLLAVNFNRNPNGTENLFATFVGSIQASYIYDFTTGSFSPVIYAKASDFTKGDLTGDGYQEIACTFENEQGIWFIRYIPGKACQEGITRYSAFDLKQDINKEGEWISKSSDAKGVQFNKILSVNPDEGHKMAAGDITGQDNADELILCYGSEMYYYIYNSKGFAKFYSDPLPAVITGKFTANSNDDIIAFNSANQAIELINTSTGLPWPEGIILRDNAVSDAMATVRIEKSYQAIYNCNYAYRTLRVFDRELAYKDIEADQVYSDIPRRGRIVNNCVAICGGRTVRHYDLSTLEYNESLESVDVGVGNRINDFIYTDDYYLLACLDGNVYKYSYSNDLLGTAALGGYANTMEMDGSDILYVGCQGSGIEESIHKVRISDMTVLKTLNLSQEFETPYGNYPQRRRSVNKLKIHGNYIYMATGAYQSALGSGTWAEIVMVDKVDLNLIRIVTASYSNYSRGLDISIYDNRIALVGSMQEQDGVTYGKLVEYDLSLNYCREYVSDGNIIRAIEADDDYIYIIENEVEHLTRLDKSTLAKINSATGAGDGGAQAYVIVGAF